MIVNNGKFRSYLFIHFIAEYISVAQHGCDRTCTYICSFTKTKFYLTVRLWLSKYFCPATRLIHRLKFKYFIFVKRSPLDYFTGTFGYFQPTFRFSHGYSGLARLSIKMFNRFARDLAAIRASYTLNAAFQYHINMA